MDHECNGAKCLWQFALKGLWSFHLGNFRKSHRGTYDHLNLFCQRNSTCKHGPFWQATCGITLGGASVIVYWFHAFVFVLDYLAFDFMYIQTLGLTMVYLKVINCENLKSTLLQISIREWGYKYLQMGMRLIRRVVSKYLQPNLIAISNVICINV